MDTIQLTKYSHGAGCGCKISPKVLDSILQSDQPAFQDDKLLIGNDKKDDAAVYSLGNGKGVVSTTDFFMPIVDDPFDFGRIAATNAISDIYSMGADPLMAISVLGWPVNDLPAEIARKVVEGGRKACQDAGIMLAGGHSIDNPEPLFGLAVTGIVDLVRMKPNSTATAGCSLFLTKPLGVGILSTAQKKNKLQSEHRHTARDYMVQLNKLGPKAACLEGVEAMTDVTGFGLLGHLTEMCEGSGLAARLNFEKVPLIPEALPYLEMGCIPGGTKRNWESYGHKISPLSDYQQHLLCDPQTSGGLLIAVAQGAEDDFLLLAQEEGFELECIGSLYEAQQLNHLIEVQ